MTGDPQASGLPNRVEADYLTPGQVADMLQVSEKTVYRWAKGDPTFPMLKLGGTVRFPRERLFRWLRDREQGRPPMRRRVLSNGKCPSLREVTGGG